MHDTPEEQEVSTEAQRQALDVMSSELVDKLNRMIEEQNARVQAFATQYPQQAEIMQEQLRREQESPAPAPRPVLPPSDPASSLPEQKPQNTVSPPPVTSPRSETPASVRRPLPLPKSQPAAPAEEKGENRIGCGKLIVIIAIIVILLRCCN